MKTAYCLSLTLLLAAPLVTTTHEEEADGFDSYSYSNEDDDKKEVEGAALPSAARPGATVVRDILDDNYHMFRRKRGVIPSAPEVRESLDDNHRKLRRKRAARPSEKDVYEENNVPVFYTSVKKQQRIEDDVRISDLPKMC